MPRVLDPTIQSTTSRTLAPQFYLSNQCPEYLRKRQNQPNQIMTQDVLDCKNILEGLCDVNIKNSHSVQQLTNLLQNQNSLQKGMGFFAAKNLLLLEYLIDLKVYELYKITGHSLTQGTGSQLYQQLAYLKTLFLKLAPVQKKLDYQKTKILRYAEKAVVLADKKTSEQQNQGQIENSDLSEVQLQAQIQGKLQEDNIEEEMNFKPRPASLLRIKKEKDNKVQKNQKYEAPRISSVLSKEEKLRQKLEKQKERKKLGLIRRLQSDLHQGEGAQETYLGDEVNEKLKKRFQERTAYEQEAFVRLPENKKDKYYRKQLMRNSMRKNQLEEDFKEVQMVRQLFDQEREMEHKMISEQKEKSGQKGLQKSKKVRKQRK